MCGVVAPHNDTVYDYVITHLRNLSNTVSEEAKHARYCLQNVVISHTKRSRFVASHSIDYSLTTSVSHLYD